MFKRTSEAKTSYMQQLEAWIDDQVIDPLYTAAQHDIPEADADEIVAGVKKSLKEKMLESYRNGQAAGPRRFGREGKR